MSLCKRKSDGAMFKMSYPDDYNTLHSLDDLFAKRLGFTCHRVVWQPREWWQRRGRWVEAGEVWKPSSDKELSVLFHNAWPGWKFWYVGGRAYEILKKAELMATYWGERIVRAEKNGRFTQNDKTQSHDWVVCACGEVYKKKPFPLKNPGLKLSDRMSRMPANDDLKYLGIRFSNEIERNDFTSSARTLVAIENFHYRSEQCEST